MSISNKALLVSLSISQWGARKIDRQATGTVESTHKTDTKVGNYTKKLLPGASELENIQRLAGALRVWFYEQTLPWASDGSRILKNTNYMDFTSAWREKEQEFTRAVAEFIYQYPKLKEEAKFKLGELFQETEYPDITDLEQAFGVSITFMPVPDVNDFRVELSENEKKQFLNSMARVEQEALQDCWNRLYTVVNKAVHKLSDPSAVFRDSLIGNIQDMCSLLPKLNVTDNPDLEAMRQTVEGVIASVSPVLCREHNQTREETAKKLADINDKMSVFMGGQ